MGARPLKLLLAKELRPSEAFVKASAVYSVTCREGSLGMMLEETVRPTDKSNAAGLHSLLPRLRRGLGSPTSAPRPAPALTVFVGRSVEHPLEMVLLRRLCTVGSTSKCRAWTRTGRLGTALCASATFCS